ncbi:MFS transporter [Micromonospora chersina]|uniref:MFS transporter n=1 Tax=Micromonospora chersina TaxID=47854 RepID=UPI0037159E90
MTSTAPVTYVGLLRSLPALRRLWAGGAISTFGDAVQGVALIWLATRTSSPGLSVSIIATALYLPAVVIGPFAGTIADRLDRRCLLLTADVLRVATACLVPLAFTHAGLWLVVAITLVHSALTALFNAAQTAALPDLTGPGSLVRANGLLSSTNYAMQVVGPAVGGFLVAGTPTAVPFLLNAATFAFSAGAVLLIPAAALAGPARDGHVTFLADLRTGVRYARHRPPIVLYMLIGIVATLGFSPAPVVLPAFATELDVGSVGFGLLSSLGGLGYAVGSVLVGMLVKPERAATAMAVGFLAMGAATLALAVAPGLALAAVLVALRSGCNAVTLVTGISMLQRIVPSALRGRIMTLTNSVQELPRPFILPFAGVVVDTAGARWVFAAMGFFIMLSGVIAVAARGTLQSAQDAEVAQTTEAGAAA